MNLKDKESVMWLCIIVVVVLFIVFMPSIESFLSGRKVKNNKEVIETNSNKTGEITQTTYPKTNTCTLSESLDTTKNAYLTKNVIFTYSNSGTVETIDLTDTYRYTDVSEYNKAKTTKVDNKVGIVQKITTDDKNMKLIVNNVMTISEMQELTEYPAGYSDLKQYLADKNYQCVEKK